MAKSADWKPATDTTRWCEKYFLWYYGEFGLRRWPKPCQSWRCRIHALVRAAHTYQAMAHRWEDAPEVWVSLAYGNIGSIEAFRSRIRQRVRRRSGSGRGHFLTVLRDIRVQSMSGNRTFDAVIFSTVDISGRNEKPFRSIALPPDTALVVLGKIALRQPGVHSISGSRGPGGWQPPLSELFQASSTNIGGLIGAAAEEDVLAAFDRVAQWAEDNFNVRPEAYAPHPIEVPLDQFRNRLSEELQRLEAERHGTS